MSDNLINFAKKKKEIIESKRRDFERIFFKSVLGCYSVVDENESIYAITLVDISNDGCLFQVPESTNNKKKFKIGKNLALRFYFTEGSYIPINVEVKHYKEIREADENIFTQYGCQFDKSTTNFQAMQSFIDFIYSFAEHSQIDKGDVKVNFI